jgi:hypothetical protein
MMDITISNISIFDKSQREWAENLGKGGFYKASGGSKLGSTDDDYISILKESIPDWLLKIPFKDEALNEEESKKLKNVLENRIKELLPNRKPVKYGRPTIHFLGEEIKLEAIPNEYNENDMLIEVFYRSYDICRECLQESKPVYLSIFEEE